MVRLAPDYRNDGNRGIPAIEDAGQEPHWAYKAGMGRLSCCFCIMATKKDLTIAAKLQPALYRKYVELERRIDHTLSPTRKPLTEITGIEIEEEECQSQEPTTENDTNAAEPAIGEQLAFAETAINPPAQTVHAALNVQSDIHGLRYLYLDKPAVNVADTSDGIRLRSRLPIAAQQPRRPPVASDRPSPESAWQRPPPSATCRPSGVRTRAARRWSM